MLIKIVTWEKEEPPYRVLQFRKFGIYCENCEELLLQSFREETDMMNFAF